RLLTATAVRGLARRHHIKPSKALGQNFVIDPNTIRRIVRLAKVSPSVRVVEIGAGLGTLSLGLVEKAKEVVAVEFDRTLLPALEEVAGDIPNLQIVSGDALELDYQRYLGDREHEMVSNLPYNIAVPLLARLLQEVPAIVKFVFTIQREVGERLTAGPGSRTYGAVSVLVAYHCESRILGRISPKVFWPSPGVESVIVELTRRQAPVKESSAEIMAVVRAAFAQRRKTLRNSLAGTWGRPSSEVETILERAGIDPSSRAEALALDEFARIAREV
ncbi:MAG: 16S rRNA (adenine(1518)-N(6)/adenine(1519)-N(6))-dimethyltransferase RsmA, partial [Actinomycetota bacterium]